MNDLVPLVAIISVFGSIILFISIFTNFFLKRKLIDKNMISPESVKLFKKQESKEESLKWGLIAFFGGLGLIIIGILGLDGDGATPYGVEAVSIAIGFLIYYFVMKKESGNKNS